MDRREFLSSGLAFLSSSLVQHEVVIEDADYRFELSNDYTGARIVETHSWNNTTIRFSWWSHHRDSQEILYPEVDVVGSMSEEDFDRFPVENLDDRFQGKFYWSKRAVSEDLDLIQVRVRPQVTERFEEDGPLVREDFRISFSGIPKYLKDFRSLVQA